VPPDEMYLPPKYNLEGRKQLWFIRTDGPADDVVNGILTGILTALLVFGLLIAAGALL